MNDLRKCRSKNFFKLPFILCIVVLLNHLLSWRRLPIQLGTSEATDDGALTGLYSVATKYTRPTVDETRKPSYR